MRWLSLDLLRITSKLNPLAVAFLATTVVLPIVALLLASDVGLLLWRRWRIRGHLRTQVVTCPRGHEVILTHRDTQPVAWRCSACSYSYVGHGWERCPNCGGFGRPKCACGLDLMPANPIAALETNE